MQTCKKIRTNASNYQVITDDVDGMRGLKSEGNLDNNSYQIMLELNIYNFAIQHNVRWIKC